MEAAGAVGNVDDGEEALIVADRVLPVGLAAVAVQSRREWHGVPWEARVRLVGDWEDEGKAKRDGDLWGRGRRSRGEDGDTMRYV